MNAEKRVFTTEQETAGTLEKLLSSVGLQKAGNKDTDLLENGLEDTGRGKSKLGRSERVVWTYIYYK